MLKDSPLLYSTVVKQVQEKELLPNPEDMGSQFRTLRMLFGKPVMPEQYQGEITPLIATQLMQAPSTEEAQKTEWLGVEIQKIEDTVLGKEAGNDYQALAHYIITLKERQLLRTHQDCGIFLTGLQKAIETICAIDTGHHFLNERYNWALMSPAPTALPPTTPNPPSVVSETRVAPIALAQVRQ